MVDFKKLKGQAMAKNNKTSDDPFSDDDWGMPDAQSHVESGAMPEASKEEYAPFLKPHHLKIKQGTMQLVGVSTEATEYSDVCLLVELNGRKFRIGQKLFAPDYKALLARFGTKKADWHGELRYKVMPHKGNPDGYIAVR